MSNDVPHRFTPNQIRRLKRTAAAEGGGTAHVTTLNAIAQREGYASWDRLVAAAIVPAPRVRKTPPAPAADSAAETTATSPPEAPQPGGTTPGARQVLLLVEDPTLDATLWSDILARIARSPVQAKTATIVPGHAVSPALVDEPPCAPWAWKDVRVMVIDDSGTITRAAQIYLNGPKEWPTGIHTVAVNQSELAMAGIRKFRPHLIFLDIMMPGVDGWTILREIRADPDLQDVRVVVLTALDGAEHRKRALADGAVELIPKPFQRERLLRAVVEHAPATLKAA